MIKSIFISALMLVTLVTAAPVYAQSTVFTADELAKNDGKDGRPAYFAYEGKVYDVTNSPTWKLGNHFGIQAGQDLTGKMDGAPHGIEVFVGLQVVGTYGEGASTSVNESASETQPETVMKDMASATQQNTWYDGRLQLFGISMLGWSGILLGVFFFLTFATCFAMPWAKVPLPWKGTRPGPDPLDVAPAHMGWSYLHKYFVWWTVILGVIHGVLGFMQLLGVYL